MSGTASAREILHFQKDSQNWWQAQGPFAPLHALNATRLAFIHRILDEKKISLPKTRVLDVGCGGGLICEPLARRGAEVTGIDADEQAIAVAKDHAKTSELPINYQATTIEALAQKTPLPFQIVLALEIVEHVENLDLFVHTLANRVAPGGLLFVSTLNRTVKSWALGKMAAEYVLGWVPPGTHTWKKFLRPSEIVHALSPYGLKPVSISGLTYDFKTQDFSLAADTSINYIMAFQKQDQ